MRTCHRNAGVDQSSVSLFILMGPLLNASLSLSTTRTAEGHLVLNQSGLNQCYDRPRTKSVTLPAQQGNVILYDAVDEYTDFPIYMAITTTGTAQGAGCKGQVRRCKVRVQVAHAQFAGQYR